MDSSALDKLEGELTRRGIRDLGARLRAVESAIAVSPELFGELCDGLGERAIERRMRHGALLLGLPLLGLLPYGDVLRQELLGSEVALEDRADRVATLGLLHLCARGAPSQAVARCGLETAVDKLIGQQMWVVKRDNFRAPIPRSHLGALGQLQYEEIEATAWTRKAEEFVLAVSGRCGIVDVSYVVDRFRMGLFQYPFLRGLFRLIGVDNKLYIADGRRVGLGDFYDSRILFYAPGLDGIVSEDAGLRDRAAMAFPNTPIWTAEEFVGLVLDTLQGRRVERPAG